MDILPLHTLGEYPVARFMREAWQRRPLLVRNALPDFAPPVDRTRLLEFARTPEAEARLIERAGTTWKVSHGPFRRLPSRRRPSWTVLVQGVDLLDDGAHALLQRFRFVPDARLDDLMVSYATDGGGVGPHVDSYDVFLLQAYGRRHWRISRQRDLKLVSGAPLRILANFRPSADYILEPGDLLYLPPGVAHEGTASGECLTYSIGFRAPTYQELLEPMLVDFAAHANLRGRFADRGLTPTRHPAALPAAMLHTLHAKLTAPRPRQGDTARFLLAYLSEPKAQVVFERPARPLGEASFRVAARRRGVALDRRTRLLYHRGAVGINGEHEVLERSARSLLQLLADARRLAPASLQPALAATIAPLHRWYLAGWLHLSEGVSIHEAI
jgi:50S ribosomal protein L16 3-hydroxylase